MPDSGPAPSPAPPAAVAPPPADAVRWIRENFEAVVVAFVMALLIRCYCIEVFKIPTASMEPTLLGDAAERNRGGDRIMVNKFIYEFETVRRYDVLVFKFPLDLTRNFIKRVVGLPDEDLLFRDGDVYVRRRGEAAFALARKPVRVQEGLWIPIYAGGVGTREFGDRWKAQAPPGSWDIVDGALRTFTVPSGPVETRFEFAPERFVIEDIDPDRQGTRVSPHVVPDLRLSARVEFLGARGEFELALKHDERTPRERTFRVVLRPGARLLVEYPDRAANSRSTAVELSEPLKAETEYRAALLVYDGSVAVILNGKTIHEDVWRSALPAPGESVGSTQIAFGTRGGAEALVRDVGIARDLYYFVISPGQEPFPADGIAHIPPQSHLLVGDNIRNSHDGRAWQRVEVDLTDGTTVLWDATLFDDRLPDRVRFYKKGETSGYPNEIAWELPRSRVKEVRNPSGMTFVERRHIVGKAFVIWWPTDRWFRLIR